MPDLTWAQAGPFAVVLVAVGWVLKLALGFARDLLGSKATAEPDGFTSFTKEDRDLLVEMQRVVDKLHEMHDVKDENGLYLWYGKRELLLRVATILEQQTEALRELGHSLSSVRDALLRWPPSK